MDTTKPKINPLLLKVAMEKKRMGIVGKNLDLSKEDTVFLNKLHKSYGTK